MAGDHHRHEGKQCDERHPDHRLDERGMPGLHLMGISDGDQGGDHKRDGPVANRKSNQQVHRSGAERDHTEESGVRDPESHRNRKQDQAEPKWRPDPV